MYTYSPVQWLLIFYAYCFFGWCFESVYVSLLQRRFVNRGFVRGPMLPLYGTGAVMMLLVSLPLENRPVPLFFAGMLAATALEYVTGWAMETLFKVKYWDYSARKMQYKGRICLLSSLAWGGLSLLLVWVIHPPIARAVLALPPLVGEIAAAVISVLFAIDLGYALRTALDLADVLAELTRLHEQMGELRSQLGDAVQDTREKLGDTVQDAREKLGDTVQDAREKLGDTVQDARSQLASAAAETLREFSENRAENHTPNAQERREKLENALAALSAAYDKRVSALGRARRWLLRGNPGAVSEKFGDALRELQEKHGRKK